MIQALHLWGFFIYRLTILSLHIKSRTKMKKLIFITMLLGVGYSQSKIESNQQNVTILTRYMTVTGTIIKYDDEKVIIYGAVSGMPGNIKISKSNIELSIKDILLIDYGIKTIYKNETDSTKRADLLNKLNKIFPEGY